MGHQIDEINEIIRKHINIFIVKDELFISLINHNWFFHDLKIFEPKEILRNTTKMTTKI
jgi:hypothetical protein